jgi:DNA-binding transcriptional ArsR family regulator
MVERERLAALEDCFEDADRRLEELREMAASVPADTGPDTAALSTLGDDTRYRLARLLTAADRECCVCELVALVAVSESAVSHALADLVEAGLAERRKEGRWRHYRATDRAEAVVTALEATRTAEEPEVSA